MQAIPGVLNDKIVSKDATVTDKDPDLQLFESKKSCCGCLPPSGIGILTLCLCAGATIIVGVITVCLTTPKPITSCNMTFKRIEKSMLAFSSEPRSMAIGNFNQDQYIDMVVTNAGTNTIGIFMGKAHGTFTNEPITYSTGRGSRPSSVAVADFNKDNQSDIAVANYGTNSIGIFFGGGNGMFSNQTILSTHASRPIFITTIDINDDHMVDILTVNHGTNSIRIFLSNGDGTFQVPLILSTGYDSLPRSLVVADLNADGIFDIAVANYGTNNIGVALGYGNGTFTEQLTYSTGHGSHPSSIAVADFNNDTELDLAIATYGSGKIYMLLGHGNGTFGTRIIHTLESKSRPSFLTTGDFNRDRLVDVVAVDPENNRVHVLLGSDNPSFSQLTTYDSVRGSRPCFAAVDDFDGDTQSDLAVVHQDAHHILLLSGYSSQASARQARYSVGRDSRPSSLVLYDFNHDGYLDVVVNNINNDYVLVFNGKRDGSFARGESYSMGDKSSPKQLSIADLNDDNYMDILVTNLGSHSISILFGQENGTFSNVVTLSTGQGSSPWFVTANDVNNDNILDIISANYGRGNIGVFLGQDDGTFAEMKTYSTGRPSFPISLAVADINHDSYSDIVVAIQSPPAAVVMLGSGNGTFEKTRTYALGSNAQPFWTVLFDVDRDQNLDLILVDNYVGIMIFLGNGDGTFRTHANYSTGLGALPYQLVVVDYNYDSYYDMVVTNVGSNEVFILLGNANGTFTFDKAYTTGLDSRPYGLVVTDYNEDGQLDVLITLWGTGEIAVLSDYQAANFARRTAYQTGTALHPSSVAIGDINEDNVTDVIVTNSGADHIEILLGSGNGTINKTMIYSLPPGSSPHYVIVEDTNNDQHLDIVVANTMRNTISILKGYGNSSFAKQEIYSTGDDSRPLAVASGHLNNDDRLDYLVANSGTDSIGIFFGYNYTTFRDQQIYSNERAIRPSAVVADDFNNDGLPDIATVFSTSEHLGILLGQGNGSFTELIIYPMKPGSNPTNIAADDIDNDGNKDIIVANFASNEIGLLFGYGNGNFSPMITFPTGDASKPRSIALGDLNNDNQTDLVVIDSGQFSVIAYLGSGNGTFVHKMSYTMDSSSNPYVAAVGDLNNDGRLDIVVGNAGVSSVGVFLGNGDGSFAAPVTYSTSDRSVPTCIIIADFNSDNRSDIAVSTFNVNTVAVLLGYGNGSFAAVASYSTGEGSVPICLSPGDLNNDAILDIVVANSYSNSIVVLFGFGDGTFLLGKPYSTGTGSSPLALAVADFDRDTRLDIATVNSKSNTIGVFFAYDYEPFSVVTKYKTGDNSQPHAVGIDDFNQDGHLDIAVANYGTNNLGIFFGYGNGKFSPMETYSTGVGSAPFSIAIHDFNNDDRPDIAVTNSKSDTVAVFLGHVNGTFVLQATYSTGSLSSPYKVTTGDMNNDQRPDLIIACFGTNNIVVYHGYGNGSFGDRSSYPLNYNYNPYSVALGDLNQDNWMDMVVACFDTNKIEILLKMC